jgi:hypothetical protein
MFFKLLNLAGIDINTKVAELRADFELKAQRISERAAVKARNLALIAGLFLGASIFLLLALIVGLVALFHWAELHYGPYTGLALVASALLILAALCVGIALSDMPSSSDEAGLYVATPSHAICPIGQSDRPDRRRGFRFILSSGSDQGRRSR